MDEELRKLLKKLFMEEPFPGGVRSRQEQRLIAIQVTIAAALYLSVVYQILTNEKFLANVDGYLESIGLAVSGTRMLIGILLLGLIPCAVIVYICKKMKKR